MTLGAGLFLTQGYDLNNFGRGLQDKATYQISKAWAVYFQTIRFLKCSYRSLCRTFDLSLKKVKVNLRSPVFQTLLGLCPQCCIPSPRAFGPWFRRRRLLKGFYHILAWWPPWSSDPDEVNILSFPLPTEAPHEIWLWLAQWFLRR